MIRLKRKYSRNVFIYYGKHIIKVYEYNDVFYRVDREKTTAEKAEYYFNDEPVVEVKYEITVEKYGDILRCMRSHTISKLGKKLRTSEMYDYVPNMLPKGVY